MPRVIVVEDDTDLRDSLVDYLSLVGHEVVGLSSGLDLMMRVSSESFDVAVVDVNLPHEDGFSLIRQLRAETDLALILVTVRHSTDDRVNGYDSGADLYLVKPVDCRELAAAINSLAERRRPSKPGLAGADGWVLDRAALELVAPDGARVRLTRSEALLLNRIVLSGGNVVTRAELQALISEPGNASSSGRALDVLLSRLRSKVKLRTGTALPLQTLQGVGFAFRAKAGTD
ncbi:response regulator transcription factor [Oryzibacter oryziterrae]|uniref:response regulator transcription factor n=1 Tax=Oryzibacter oryziterrae TaxID=2766474 RepID=UPI001F1CCFB3|nr:response regulator transcription factor [Oryzibacter oryziterrae]